MKVTKENVLSLIEKYSIELEPQMYDEETEEELEVAASWSAFSNTYGGCWQEGKTIIEAVQAIVGVITIEEEIN